MSKRVSILRPGDVTTNFLDKREFMLRNVLEECMIFSHGISVTCGWYQDPKTGKEIDRNDGEQIALMHSELSEALEGIRKNKMDDHLPHRLSVEVELADALHRIFDFAGKHNLDLAGAYIEKARYNLTRDDHKPENRAAGGKAF